MKKQFSELKKQLEEKNNLYLRALADYQNLEKRLYEEKKQDNESLLFRFLIDLIELKEDMSKAEAFVKDSGLRLVQNKLDKILARYNVVEVSPLNQKFSPDTMECVQTEEGLKDNIVTKVFSKGYLCNDKLLQPAKVCVSQLKVSQKNGSK
jgi:molecular chaperone GrpE